ncbi:DUF3304 domain-containing protein [Providencia vermicola]|uniref:DUF3304 domain-containing protein n=1 Tax=Providencia vermicola TaxID=333965 RepID=A0AAX3RVY0_9GAMM|nr:MULTISPECIES: DUF3304 domain-containing protein [Providencia]ELX8379040.1 DUF3304 domain-containing protein [Providencia stuartii]EMD5258244.1 DUF3304 domain-containing protein [Providencia stuartii]MCK1143575.1 DUF3304 domain-containing protein [Providencia stuartii]QIC16656.1 DUF3304 domain-containing protein [Providencia vermicola]USB36717.1 DUF3304 domain-containing protein [Providencia vermicola]
MPEITLSRLMIIQGTIATTLCTLVLMLSGCSFAASTNHPMAAGLSGYNHTQGSITSFSVNGSSASVGGVQCCVLLPAKWAPGLQARIKWESLNTSKLSPMPKFSQVEAYKRWEAELERYSTQHEVSVPIPEYDSKTACGLDVHFLPCNQVKVTTSCKSYGSDGYPINEPMDMKEPAVCPK